MKSRSTLLRRIALSVFASLLVSGAVMLVLLRVAASRFERSAVDRLSGLGARAAVRELSLVGPDERPARLRVLARDFSVPLDIVPGASLPMPMPPPGEPFDPPGPPGAPPPMGPPPGFGPEGSHEYEHEHEPRFGRARGHDFAPGFISPIAHGPGRGRRHGHGGFWARMGLPPGGVVLPPEHGPRDGGPGAIRVAYPLPDGQALVVGPIEPPLPNGFWPIGFIAFGFLVLATGLASALVAWPLSRRLRAIEDAVEALSRGDFDARVEGPRDDALGRVAAALDRSAERLRRLFAEREELLQAVSHELGTPLSRMRFQLELLEHAAEPAKREKHLRALDQEIQELDELSSELVRWVEADARELHPEPTDVRPLLDEVIELERAATTRDVPVELVVRDGAALRARVEPRAFERAVENVLRNALRYAHSRVRIEAFTEGPALQVRVSDDGPGIPQADRARVLQPFVRLERSRSREHGGTGLGLAIARRIVERHAGAVSIGESTDGGAAITLSWPVT